MAKQPLTRVAHQTGKHKMAKPPKSPFSKGDLGGL